MKHYFVYLMASKSGTLYIGVTNTLLRRVGEHQTELATGFTQKYHCHKLVYFEEYTNIKEAIAREKQLKTWSRKKKEVLIARVNPGWRDLDLDLKEMFI